mmetsp:Transcript_13993/g.27906  ORF Transcript_13993/g.27906 Transcript_13993/m.27906 type:complete len:129 (+) Transcript_13993:355-741(+)
MPGGPNKKGYGRLPQHEEVGDGTNGDDFIQSQSRHQQDQLRIQDEGLEMLSVSAARLGELSLNIHEEVGTQNKMLDDMHEDLDQAAVGLDLLTNKTQLLIQSAGGKKYFCLILVLSLVLLILVLLVLS